MSSSPKTISVSEGRKQRRKKRQAPRATANSNAANQLASNSIMSARGIEKSYQKGPHTIPVLRGVDLDIREGEFMSIVGQSGSGKSTLLHLLGTLDTPDAGQLMFEGNRIDTLSNNGRDLLRNRHFGMVFQFYHLLPELTTLENVLLPQMIGKSIIQYWRERNSLKTRAKELLEMVGLSHRLTHKPRELSGGEMQRTAIARALLSKPRILFADEPTGNLDRGTGTEVIDMLRTLNDERKLTIVMVTHDLHVAQQADRIVTLVEGRVEKAGEIQFRKAE